MATAWASAAAYAQNIGIVCQKEGEAARERADEAAARLGKVLAAHKLDKLVNARNPLDLTPMATDQAYEECVRVLLDSPDVDAVIASLVPLTPAMLTTPKEITKPGSLVERLPKILAGTDKPVIVNVDSGPLYEPMVNALRAAGVPVFRSCDQAVRVLGRYICQRVRGRARRVATMDADAVPTPEAAADITQPAKA